MDIVVNGAGLFDPKWSHFWEAPKTETNPDTVSRDPADSEPGHYAVLDVNLTAPIRLSQLAIGHWTTTKQKGCLVFIGSIAGYTSASVTPLYFASKHGLHGFVRSLQSLKSELGIRAGCVAPGAVSVSFSSPPSSKPIRFPTLTRPDQTPMLLSDPTKSVMLDENTVLIAPEEIAAGMWELVTNEEYGDGTILEVTKGETRVIPEFGLEPPTGGGSTVPGYYATKEALMNELKTKGLSV